MYGRPGVPLSGMPGWPVPAGIRNQSDKSMPHPRGRADGGQTSSHREQAENAGRPNYYPSPPCRMDDLMTYAKCVGVGDERAHSPKSEVSDLQRGLRARAVCPKSRVCRRNVHEVMLCGRWTARGRWVQAPAGRRAQTIFQPNCSGVALPVRQRHRSTKSARATAMIARLRRAR